MEIKTNTEQLLKLLKNKILSWLSKYSRIVFGKTISDRIMAKLSLQWFIENDLFEILGEEIRKEIDNEIIKTIRGTNEQGSN